MGRALQRQCPVARPGRIRDIPENCHWGNSQEKLFPQVQAQRGNVKNSNQGGNEIKPLGLGLTYGWRYSRSYAAHHDLGNEYASPDFQHLTTCSLLRKKHPSSLAFFAYQDTHTRWGTRSVDLLMWDHSCVPAWTGMPCVTSQYLRPSGQMCWEWELSQCLQQQNIFSPWAFLKLEPLRVRIQQQNILFSLMSLVTLIGKGAVSRIWVPDYQSSKFFWSLFPRKWDHFLRFHYQCPFL